MKHCLIAFLFAVLLTLPEFAEAKEDLSNCDQLVALFIELAERSGETVTKEQAKAEVMSENPSQAECGAMLALFESQK